MIAGTLARLQEPAAEALTDTYNGSDLPALDVRTTQRTLDDRPIQQGYAGTRLEVDQQVVDVAVGRDGTPGALDVHTEPEMTDIATEWVADVTGTGVIAAESVAGPDRWAFPFDLFATITDRTPDRLGVDIEAMHEAWVMGEEDGLADAWMVGQDDGESTEMQYHDAAEVTTQPTFGLGFVKPWNNTVSRGVAYESGYVAVYNATSAEAFIRFVGDAILPYTYPREESEQTTLGGEA